MTSHDGGNARTDFPRSVMGLGETIGKRPSSRSWLSSKSRFSLIFSAIALIFETKSNLLVDDAFKPRHCSCRLRPYGAFGKTRWRMCACPMLAGPAFEFLVAVSGVGGKVQPDAGGNVAVWVRSVISRSIWKYPDETNYRTFDSRNLGGLPSDHVTKHGQRSDDPQ